MLEQTNESEKTVKNYRLYAKRREKVQPIRTKYGAVFVCEGNILRAIEKVCKCSEVMIMKTIASYHQQGRPFRCFLSVTSLAESAGVKKKAASQAIKRLEKRRLLSVNRRGQWHLTNQYQIKVRELLVSAFGSLRQKTHKKQTSIPKESNSSLSLVMGE